MEKHSKIKMHCRHGIWTVTTVFYNTEIICMAESVRSALSGLKESMHYLEYGLAMRVIRGVAS